jgi:hypothetical protein
MCNPAYCSNVQTDICMVCLCSLSCGYRRCIQYVYSAHRVLFSLFFEATACLEFLSSALLYVLTVPSCLSLIGPNSEVREITFTLRNACSLFPKIFTLCWALIKHHLKNGINLLSFIFTRIFIIVSKYIFLITLQIFLIFLNSIFILYTLVLCNMINRAGIKKEL